MTASASLDGGRLRSLIRAIPDFPEPGILFRDITPLLHDPAGLRETNDALAEVARGYGATLVAGIEARGFIFGVPVAERLGLPFVPMRKPGKLPAEHASVAYELEYGSAALELHRDPSVDGHRVAIVDDLLATGGTAEAAVAVGRGPRWLGGRLRLRCRARRARRPRPPRPARGDVAGDVLRAP